MSRRDTIIIAVLVNAGLLMVLFATAFRSNKSTPEKSHEAVQMATAPAREVAPMPDIAALPSESLLSNDEVDQVLDQLVAAPSLSNVPSANIVAVAPDLGLEITPPTAPIITPIAPVRPQPVPSAPARPAATSESTFVNVTVKKGDYLEKIAKANNSSVTAIMKANNMTSTNLKIGQVLKVPSKGDASVPAKSETAPASSQSEFYVVKEGG